MGIIIFIFYIIPYVSVSYLVLFIASKLTRKSKQKTKNLVKGLILAIIFLIPTYDIIITSIIGGYYCLTNKESFVKEKNSHPKSIYFENNFNGGYIVEGPPTDVYSYKSNTYVKDMIDDYLYPNFLETVAFNLKDGKVLIASFDKSLKEYQEYVDALKKYKEARRLVDKYREELYSKIDSGEIQMYSDEHDKYVKLREEQEKIRKYYDNLTDELRPKLIVKTIVEKKDMPKMNYTIIYNKVELNKFSSMFFDANEITVINNKTDETIGYKRRYFKFPLLLHFSNIGPYKGKYICNKPKDLLKDIFVHMNDFRGDLKKI